MKNRLARLENAGIYRDGRFLVRGVDLDLCAGEIVTLIGPNGSGKSTTAKMVLNILTPDEGQAWRADSLRIGYVPQKLSIDWTLPLSVSRFMQLTNRLGPEQIEAALALTNTGNLVHEQVRTLSGGEFQRVLLARAIARNPGLLVLDEPVQGVDFTGGIAIYDLIKTIRDKIGCGILLVSHDLHLVMAATDHVLCLNGHVCCHGTPKSVAESRQYRDIFGPEAAAALAVYQHDHDHVHLPDGSVCHDNHEQCDHEGRDHARSIKQKKSRHV